MGVKKLNRFDVLLADFSGSKGREIQKTRPCLVVSPNELNHRMRTVLVAPLTSTIKGYPFRVRCTFQGKEGEIALDQTRTMDGRRFLSRLGSIEPSTGQEALRILRQMFAD
ncbi:MAG: mRNA interferase MazF [Rhodothermales bacterium]|jgi:mRNA interferase MazF